MLAKLLNMINEQLEGHGILVRTGSILDATLIPSARRARKVEEVIPDELASEDNDAPDNDHPTGYTVETSYSDDHDARWTRKGKAFCYGYKGHLAVDVGHGFILGGHATAANRTLIRAPRSWQTRATAAQITGATWRRPATSTSLCIGPPGPGL